MNQLLKAFWSILLQDKVGSRFLVAVIFSVSFSIAIILSTVGLMDGFQDSLTSALRDSLGDVVMTHRKGLFVYNDSITKQLSTPILKAHASAYQIEGFLISERGERGVRVLAIRDDYSDVSKQDFDLEGRDITIGVEIAKSYDLIVGDEVELAFVTGSSKGNIVPTIHSFIIKSIVNHKVFEKDSRMAYVSREYISEIGLSQKDNIIFGLLSNEELAHKELSQKVSDLRLEIGESFRVKLFGGEYQSLIKAVELEKVSISIILQIIVLVSVFNIAAFVTFISEKKAKDFFLLRALGIPFKKICFFWASFMTGIWSVSCIVAIVFTYFFDFLLGAIPWLQIPGEIYVLSRLMIKLSLDDYLIVFGASALWIGLVGAFALLRMSKKGLLGGLREEFA